MVAPSCHVCNRRMKIDREGNYLITQYFTQVQKYLHKIKEKESEMLDLAAKLIAHRIASGGIIYLFGCGHSHLLTEEVFYRAGGLAPVYPILVEDVMLHRGAMRSSQLERQADWIEEHLQGVEMSEQDVCIVISTSGVNPVPIDVAQFAKIQGAFTIGLTSTQYSQKGVSRHRSGLCLSQVVDLVIDNHVPPGDAVLKHERVPVSFGPISTVMGVTILHAILSQVTAILGNMEKEVPVFQSGNLPGTDQYNQDLVQMYLDRIPHLKGDIK